VEQDAFQKSHSKLAMCLGKDIEGMPYVADLAKMPHLLIAGTTGSGKSVRGQLDESCPCCCGRRREEVRVLDGHPKMLELSVYEGIPHLLLPVVTDAKKAAIGAAAWGVEEMERRYQLLAECGVRNIASYNKKVEKEGDAARRPQKPPKEKRVVDLSDPKARPARAASGGRRRRAAAQGGRQPGSRAARENERRSPQAATSLPCRRRRTR